jgi:4-oxalocrotonate tautomerase
LTTKGIRRDILNKKNKENTVATIKEQIREAARVAEAECINGDFNAMSWLDLLLEENPESFDVFFNKAWAELSEDEMLERNVAIRKVL